MANDFYCQPLEIDFLGQKVKWTRSLAAGAKKRWVHTPEGSKLIEIINSIGWCTVLTFTFSYNSQGFQIPLFY